METRLSYRDISSDDNSIKLEVSINSDMRILSNYSIHLYEDHNFNKFYFKKNRSSNPIEDPSNFIEHLKRDIKENRKSSDSKNKDGEK